MARHGQTGVNRSSSALGLGYGQWTLNDLSVILSHYRVHFTAADSKNDLMTSLNQLATQRGLTRQDRLNIINAHNSGAPLPSRKPIVRAQTVRSTLAQPIVHYPSIAQASEHISKVSDGSDVDMSDGETVEELPSLSDEERDLRAYTAMIMSKPNTGGQRRPLRKSTASTAADRPLPADRPVIEDQSVTIKNRAAPIRRSNTSAASHLGNTGRSRSNRSARLRTTGTDSTARPRSGPVASEAVEAEKHDCLICYSSFDPIKTPMRQPTSSCIHEVNICKPCLSASITSQLEYKLWTRISCPASLCEEILEYGDVQEFAEPQIFAR